MKDEKITKKLGDHLVEIKNYSWVFTTVWEKAILIILLCWSIISFYLLVLK